MLDRFSSPRQAANQSATYHPLVLLLCAFAAGITLDHYAPFPATLTWLAVLLGPIAWFILWKKGADQASSWILLATFLATGAAWHHSYWRLYPAYEIGRSFDETLRPVVLEATAITSPRWSPAPPPTPLRTIPRGESSELLLWVTAVRDGRDFRPASGWATLLVDGQLSEIRAGDRLRVFGQAARPAAPLNPGEFDFAAHERRQRICCRLFAEFPESIQRLSRGSPFSPRRWLADFRSTGIAILNRYIAPERAALASAILLGAREQLDPDRNENFLVTGTIHILSVSGLHVGILAFGFFLILRTGLLPRPVVIVFTIVLTTTYALLIDLEPPVVRATLLIIVACLALFLGRAALGFNVLSAAALVVLARNPASLFQAGPQLSFLAVATLIACRPLLIRHAIDDPLDRLIANTRPLIIRSLRRFAGVLWRIWLAGALIWLTSTPLVWKQYNLISPVALLLNFLLWIPVTLAMYAGMATLLLGSFFPRAARLAGLACDQCLQVVESLTASFRDLPASYTWLSAPPAWWIALLYVAFALLVAIPPLRPSRRWLCTLAACWIAGACLLSDRSITGAIRFAPRPLRCDFVAVGHGLCVLVELPDGKTLLYDAGRLGSPFAGVRPISALLWSRGINHLDCLIISHADADHYNAIPELFDRYSVGAVYVSPVMFRRLPAAVQVLRDAIEQANIPLREIHAGQRLAGGGAVLEVLHPPPAGVSGSDNANSIVLLLEYSGRRILLTGDLEPPGLGNLFAAPSLDCDVVLAPHHGSPRSNPGGFADWSRPEHVVMSASRTLGDIATLERVKDSLRLRGAEVFHTAEDGCTSVRIDPSGTLSVTTFREHVRATNIAPPGANFLQTE